MFTHNFPIIQAAKNESGKDGSVDIIQQRNADINRIYFIIDSNCSCRCKIWA